MSTSHTTTLEPTTTKTQFTFPSIYNFPPFFTYQPTLATWQNQCALWSRIILAYYRHHRLWRMDLNEALGTELFYNEKKNRRLDLEALKATIEEMTRQGTAEWDTLTPTKRTQCFIYWRKPEEWANLIHAWVIQNGMNNSIMTVYEIANGEISEGTEFYEMDSTVLSKALDVLAKRGVAQVFAGTNPEDVGVKFFG